MEIALSEIENRFEVIVRTLIPRTEELEMPRTGRFSGTSTISKSMPECPLEIMDVRRSRLALAYSHDNISTLTTERIQIRSIAIRNKSKKKIIKK